jgi:CRISPR-associated endonuclease/helicase Cas3
LAAYCKADQQHSTRRLYFCYPTTGTTTEGFKDYLFVPESSEDTEDNATIREIKARLFHSRADIDFDVILDAGTDERETDPAARLEALAAWSTPVVACTADTVLGVIQNNRRGLFAWPALARAAVVFDEIHSYDNKLFGALLRFLKALPGIPVLLMTASLPRARLEAIRQVVAKRGATFNEIGGPPELENQPRYRGEEAPSNLLDRIRRETAEGGKVLWVCNTVSRAIARFDDLEEAHLAPRLYHSRFRYVDRVERHKEVVRAFQPKETPGAAVAVCTQVAEMSLDLKGVTLLVTELAPIAPLIQRLGRLNRDAKTTDPARPFIVLEPENSLPYSEDDLAEAAVWLAKLGGADLSQASLIAAWEELGPGSEPGRVDSAWLDGGPLSVVRELREGSPGLSVLLEDDARRVEQGDRPGGYILPMPPPPKDWKSWKRVKGIPVVPANRINYDAKRGGSWRNHH